MNKQPRKEAEEELTPPCCKGCKHLTKTGYCLIGGTGCWKWREWFHKEWEGIRKAAGMSRDKKEEPKE